MFERCFAAHCLAQGVSGYTVGCWVQPCYWYFKELLVQRCFVTCGLSRIAAHIDWAVGGFMCSFGFLTKHRICLPGWRSLHVWKLALEPLFFVIEV